METIENINRRKEQLRREIEALDKAEKEVIAAGKDGRDYELASFLHERLCTHNHTDGCGWHYDDGSWTEYSRKKYLTRARALIAKGEMTIDFGKDPFESIFDFMLIVTKI